jgi:hypothetical protein
VPDARFLAMLSKKIIVWAVVISVAAALVYRRPQIMAYYEVRKLAQQDHLLSVVPQPLFDTSVSASPGTTLSNFGYQYEVPWTDIVKVKQSDTIMIVGFKSGKALSFFDPASAPDGAKIMRAATADSRNVLSVFGPQATQTNYALASTILNLTPKRVSFWMSSREATGTAILLQLKPIYTVNAETGLFSVRTLHYRGYQFGDPQRVRQVDLSVFDDQYHEFRFAVGSDPGKPLTITQPDINRILDTQDQSQYRNNRTEGLGRQFLINHLPAATKTEPVFHTANTRTCEGLGNWPDARIVHR